jgi:hypothetical protein
LRKDGVRAGTETMKGAMKRQKGLREDGVRAGTETMKGAMKR